MPNTYHINAGKKYRITKIEVDHEKKTCSYIFSLPSEPAEKQQQSRKKINKHLQQVFSCFKVGELINSSNNEQGAEYVYIVRTKEVLEKTSAELFSHKSYVKHIDLKCKEDIKTLITSMPQTLSEGESTTTVLENVDEQLKQEIDKCENADINLITKLILQGANVNVQGVNSGWTAAHVAVKQNNTDLMRLLAKKQADLNLQENSEGRTPLFYAQSVAMVKLLTDEDANLLQQDTASTKSTALQHLIMQGIVTADDLLKKEIDKLIDANLDLVKALIICGANVNAQGDQSGWTAAHLAVQKNNVSLINFLIERQADLNLSSRLRGNSPLSNATTVEMVSILVKNNANYVHSNNLQQKAYRMLLANFEDKKEVQDEIKRLLLAQELQKANFKALNLELLQDCALSENHATQLKELHRLGCLIDTQVMYLRTQASQKTLTDGKINLYKQLRAQIRTAMKNDSLNAQELSGLKYQTEHFEERKDVKRLVLVQELEKSPSQDFDIEILKNYAVSESHARQLQVLQRLDCFMTEQMARLQKQPYHQKGIEDKVSLYKLLKEQIRTAMKNDSLSTQDLTNLIYQTATISHHRRYRTSNKAIALLTFGVYSIEATSWQSYHEFVNREGASFGAELHQVFQQSLRIRKDKISCILHPEDNNEADIEVQGYEEYRNNQLMPH